MTGNRVQLDMLVKMFEDVLEVSDVRPDSNFFNLGGDSLLATRVISRLARAYDIDLTFAEFSQAPTPRALRDLVGQLRDPALS